MILRGEIDKSGPLQGQRISISDNGPGIPSEALTKIFMPFYTTKANGTGLGLAVVQKIVVQHGGSIEARNQAGRAEPNSSYGYPLYAKPPERLIRPPRASKIVWS